MDQNGKVALKAEVTEMVKAFVEGAGYEATQVVEGIVFVKDEQYIVLKAVVKKANFDFEDAKVEYADKLKAKADREEKAAEKKAKAAAKKAEKE